MIGKLVGFLGCVRGRHHRSSRRAHRTGEQYESVCEHCGVPMVRLRKRHWIVKRD